MPKRPILAAAASMEPSGMAALIGADLDAARSICERRVAGGGRLEVANVNAPGQVVVAGGESDMEWLVANVADLGARQIDHQLDRTILPELSRQLLAKMTEERMPKTVTMGVNEGKEFTYTFE